LADSDDILSDALTALFGGGLAQFRGETIAELIAFLKAVVRNRAIDFLKERSKWSPTDSLTDRPSEESVALPVSRDPFDVASGIADDECVEFLRQEVAKLKQEDQELFLMKARGLKEREIVEQTGRPPGTISSQIARLLDRLRANLRERGCA
jgi:RNA polymerase sigma factor (sigma-70 family)